MSTHVRRMFFPRIAGWRETAVLAVVAWLVPFLVHLIPWAGARPLGVYMLPVFWTTFVAVYFYGALAGLAPRRCRPFLAKWLHNPVLLVPELLAVIFAGASSFRINRSLPPLLTDDELRSIQLPTRPRISLPPVILLTGGDLRHRNTAQARDRLASLSDHKAISADQPHGRSWTSIAGPTSNIAGARARAATQT